MLVSTCNELLPHVSCTRTAHLHPMPRVRIDVNLYVPSALVSWRRWWHPTPVLLPGKPHGRRSLVGCSPWGREESDTTERLHFHFSLSCIGEGNGNPLQCSCLENPRDGGAWWAAVYRVAQSRIPLKRLSSSSRKIQPNCLLDSWSNNFCSVMYKDDKDWQHCVSQAIL